MKRWGWIFGVLALALGVVVFVRPWGGAEAAALPPVPEGGFAELDVRTLKSLLDDPERAFVLVNVHVPYEGEIPGTDLQFPYDQVAVYAAKLLPDRDRPIVVYCRSGAMSRIAVEALVQLGYTRVYNVPGGMQAWRAAGFPLVFKESGGNR